MGIPEVRRRLRAAIDSARREAAARRQRADEASQAYETFLAERAIPAFHALALALAAEGYRFTVETPAGSVRLASERSREDFIEVLLDRTHDPPIVIGRTSRGRGRGQVTSERPVCRGSAISDLTEEDVLTFVLEEIAPFVER
ncbi:MAG TPA: hypothetical protein VLD67_06765 [Vicinamibacterales bacterium]|nr:hypothetical protein [Vicinamibacterales bacterium]